MTVQLDEKFAAMLGQAIALGLQQGQKGRSAFGLKAPATTPSAVGWTHGVGGIFGVPGLEQDVISARITPRGISSVLKVYGDIYSQPIYPYITGFEEAGDAEPTTECETCPSGELESCIQSACFGFICRESRTLTPNRALERLNRGEFDLTLANDILGLDARDPWQVIRNYDMNTILQIATAQAMLEVGILMQNAVVPMVWQGNPANNVGTGYAEFWGLDGLISTGKVDFISGVRCDALDSDVKDFNFQQINAVVGGNFVIVRMLEYLDAYLYHNADRMNLLPVDWAIVMRPEMWYELTNIWPVAYLTTRNVVLPAGNTNFIDSARVRDMMDEMREGQYLFLNGRRHMVVLDDGIIELDNGDNANIPAGSFASNIYMVPLTYLGGRDATYLQHKDYRGVGREIAAAEGLLSNAFIISDGGRFLWALEQQKYCYTLSGKVEPRIVLRTPQLAGRINNIVYTPQQHLRQPFQDQDYFLKGGVSHRAYPYGTVYPDHARTGVTPTRGACED